jgi:hypothetical protein
MEWVLREAVDQERAEVWAGEDHPEAEWEERVPVQGPVAHAYALNVERGFPTEEGSLALL